jgi:hypothetical protein
MMPRILTPTIVILLASTFVACVGDRRYRIEQSVYYEKLKISDFDPTERTELDGTRGAYHLAFIEFNDKGEMFAPAQRDAAIKQIALARATSVDPPLVVVFVHGWKNNASVKSGNVWGFRQVLAGLARQNAIGGTNAKVVGIYVGWRGATISAPLLKEFTVFDRHHASQRVGVPVMPGVIEGIITESKAMDKGLGHRPATLVMIGHSFGGAVLEAAVTPSLSRAISDARSAGRKTVDWPTDLIILLNEAQEAERSYPLIEQMHAEMKPRNPCAPPGPTKPQNQRPAIMSISSTGDIATRGFFPGQQLLARPFQRRTYKGSDPYDIGGLRLYYATTAHIGTLRSHLLGRSDDPDIVSAETKCKESLETILSRGAADTKYHFVERSDAKNRTPYWVTHMPPAIVPDHSTIFTQVFRDFVISLIEVALQYDPHNELRD